MNLNLLAGRLSSSLRGILVYALAIVLFMVLVLSSFSALGGNDALFNMFKALPTAMTAMIGGDISRLLKVEGYIGIGFVHPITIVMLAAFAIGIGVNAIAGEIDRGTINLLLARPVRRRDLVLTPLIQLIIGLAILGAAFMLGIWLGLQTLGTNSGSVQFSALVLATGLTCMMFLTIGAYTLLFSAASSDAGRATLFAAGLTLVFYFMNYLSQLSSNLKFLETWSIFHYWDPGGVIINNRLETTDVAVFTTLTVGSILIALLIIERRDITA